MAGKRHRTVSACEDVTLQEIRELVGSDVLANDCLFSLFFAAVNSVRCDSLVRPFPAGFRLRTSNEDTAATSEPDFDRLRRCADQVPPLELLCRDQPTEHQRLPAVAPESDTLHLLGWLLKSCPSMLSSVSPALFSEINAAAGGVAPHAKPSHIFAVQRRRGDDCRALEFEAAAREYGVITCYHGTALENVHSILVNGFLNRFNTQALYGEGTYVTLTNTLVPSRYFSTDVSVCFGFIKAGMAWGKSMIGPRLSCIAVCDVAKHPTVTLPGQTVNRSLIDSTGSAGGTRVPDTYIVVPNDNLIRLRYLFVYAEERPASAGSGFRAMVTRYSSSLTLVCYAIVLLLVGLFNSPDVRKWFRRRTRSWW